MSEMRELLVVEAMKCLGAPSHLYRGPEQGLDPETGLDCSGYLNFLVFIKLGIPNPLNLRHTNELFDQFGVLVHPELRERGDLVFFSRNGLLPTHVGILTGPTTFIHAPGKDGTVVCIAPLEFSGISRREGSIYTIDPIGFKRPSIPDGRYQKIL